MYSKTNHFYTQRFITNIYSIKCHFKLRERPSNSYANLLRYYLSTGLNSNGHNNKAKLAFKLFGSVNKIINRFSDKDFLRAHNDVQTMSAKFTWPANVQKNYIWFKRLPFDRHLK